MQVEIGSLDGERGTSRHDNGRAMGDPASEALTQPHSQHGSVRSSTDEPLPACIAAKGALAAYCSSLLRTYVDVKLSEPPTASHDEIHTITARLAAALPAAFAATQLGVAWRYTRAAPAGLASSSSALGVAGSAAAAAACLLGHATCTVTHAAALGGTFQLVFEVVEATAPALAAVPAVAATPADAVAAVAALGAALPSVLPQAAAEQQQVEAVEQALQQALKAALLPGWGIKSVKLDPQVQAQQQQQQQRSLQDEVVVALAAAAQGLALRPAAVGLPPTPAAAGTDGSSSSRGTGHTSVDEVSVAVELLLPAHSVQQLLAAGQESLRAVVLSCTPGRLLGHLLLDKAWKLQQDGDEDGAVFEDAAAGTEGRGAAYADGPTAAASGFGVAAAAAGSEQSAGARSLQLQLRIIREKPQQQQGAAGSADGPAAAAAVLKIDGGADDAEGRSDGGLSECQVLSVVLMTAPAAAEPTTDQLQDHSKQAASPVTAAASAAESCESGEGDVMLAQLPLLVLPAGAQAELQRQFEAAAAAGVPYAAMYRQLLPLLQDCELLLTLYGLSNDSSSSSDGGGADGIGSAEVRDGDGIDDSRAAAYGGCSKQGGSMSSKGSGRAAALNGSSSSSSSDGHNHGWGSGDDGSDGSAIDTDQLKAAAAALAAYFVAHHMPECLQLVQAIERQLKL